VVLFVETPRKCITAKLSIRKPGSSSVLIIYILLALMKIPAYGSKALDIISFANVVLLFRKVYYTLAIHAMCLTKCLNLSVSFYSNLVYSLLSKYSAASF
jgi:hypothetical protein